MSVSTWWRTGFTDQMVLFPPKPGEKNRKTIDWLVDFDSASRMPMSFKDECINAAKKIYEEFNGDVTVLLSGGKDSELVCRSFYEANLPFKVVIFAFPDNKTVSYLNQHDIDYAISYCDSYDIEYEIVEYKLFTDFYLNKDLYLQYTPLERSNAYGEWMWMIEQLNRPTICGNGVFFEYTYRIDPNKLPSNYKFTDGMDGVYGANLYHKQWLGGPENKGTDQWVFKISEREGDTIENFFKLKNIPGVMKFFASTPELVLSQYFDTSNQQIIIGNKEIGNLLAENKNKMFKSHFPDMIERPKFTGYENIYIRDEFKKFVENDRETVKFEEVQSRSFILTDFISMLLPYSKDKKQIISEYNNGVNLINKYGDKK